VGIQRLGQVEGDDAVGVADRDVGAAVAGEQVEAEPARFAA